MLIAAHRQRTVSEFETESQMPRGELTIKLIEARLNASLSRISQPSPYFKVLFGKETWKSETSSGLHPKWNTHHSFSKISQTMLLVLYDKGFILSDTEIGRCTIHISDVIQGHSTEWWSLVSPKQEVAGGVLLSFEFHDSDSSFTHSSNSSWDYRSGYPESSPIFSRIKKVHSIQISNMTPESHKPFRFNTEPDEAFKLEQVKYDLIEEDERLKTQETKVRLFFDKLKQENEKLNFERKEVNKDTEALKRREESILIEKAELESEKEAVEQGWADIERSREGLNSSFSLLKMEKLRARVQRSLLEKSKKKEDNKGRLIDSQKKRLERFRNDRMELDRE